MSLGGYVPKDLIESPELKLQFIDEPKRPGTPVPSGFNYQHLCDDELTEVQKLIIEVGEEVVNMLIEKNRKYGNSALNPTAIFAKGDPVDLINIRIDDKLSRKANQNHDEDEDIDLDLIGYLILKRAAIKRRERSAVGGA